MPPAGGTEVAPTISERVEKMNPDDFGSYLRGKWNALETRLIAPIIEGVEAGEFTPVEGARMASCVTGEVLGYKEFHGSILSQAPADLFNQLVHGVKQYEEGTSR